MERLVGRVPRVRTLEQVTLDGTVHCAAFHSARSLSKVAMRSCGGMKLALPALVVSDTNWMIWCRARPPFQRVGIVALRQTGMAGRDDTRTSSASCAKRRDVVGSSSSARPDGNAHAASLEVSSANWLNIAAN